MAQKSNKKPMDDEELLTRVEQKVKMGVGWLDSRLSKERSRVIRYYNSKLPLKQNDGRSSYISSDVYDSTETMKAQLLETFSGNPDNIVSFPALHEQDVEAARIATEYCSYQIWEMNDGYGVCHDAMHDGFTARVGITKVYWDECHRDIEERFENLREPDVMALAGSDEIVELDAEETGLGTGIFNGTLCRRVDTSQVRIDPVPPEEFVIEKRAPTIAKAGMTCHRTRKSKAELLREGYDPKKVELINWDDARSADLTDEDIERNDPISDSTASEDDGLQPEQEKVMVYESYVKIDLYDGKGTRLIRVCHAGHQLLEKEEVDRTPFIGFVPLRVPHVFHGNNFAARVIPTQNARTVLTRAILDHASVTTNPRWGVVKGGLLNPKEMLDNRLGGIVNLSRPDAIAPLEQQSLNPFIFQTLEMLKQNKEESTGISSLAQGMNKDAISTQNSQGLVDQMVTLSMQRQKIVARNFAWGYLVPLYLEVYRLVLENEKQEKIAKVAGNFVRISTADWVERTTCKVALHLGYGERDKQAATLTGLYAGLAQDPGIAPAFQLNNRIEMANDIMRARGIEGYSKYLTPAEKVPPPQPDPLKVKELEIKDKTANAAMMQAQGATLKNEKAAAVASMREMLREMQSHIDAISDAHDQDRKDADVANRINISQREMALAEKYPPTQTKGVVAPQG